MAIVVTTARSFGITPLSINSRSNSGVAIVRNASAIRQNRNNKKVDFISSLLEDVEDIGFPYKLNENANKSFKGIYVFGPGFVLDKKDSLKLQIHNVNNKEVIFPYLIILVSSENSWSIS
jgi:hypothetical protein